LTAISNEINLNETNNFKQQHIIIDLNNSGMGKIPSPSFAHHRTTSTTTTTASSLSSTPSESSSINDESSSDDGEDEDGDMDFVSEQLSKNATFAKLTFRSNLSDQKEIEWKTYLHTNDDGEKHLYINISLNYILCDGIRDSFVSLLEFAEDKLKCHKVFIWFNKSRVDRQTLMRTFMFFGFKTVTPGNTRLAVKTTQNDDIIVMLYEID
jgi:hypothetical protein